MSIFAALTTLSFFCGHALSQYSAATCNSTLWGWVRLNHFIYLSFTNPMSKAFNSIGQDPCKVRAYLLSPCIGDSQSFSHLSRVPPSHPHSHSLCPPGPPPGRNIQWSPPWRTRRRMHLQRRCIFPLECVRGMPGSIMDIVSPTPT
jgi:hypothetical protein